MKKFNWAEFLNKNNKIAVHCKTEEEAIDFCEQMNKHGLRFSDGGSYIFNNYWRTTYEEKMIYSNDGMYGTQWDYSRGSWKIYEWSEYMEHEFTKDMLKTGMFIKQQNDIIYEVLLDTKFGDILINKIGFNYLTHYKNNLGNSAFSELNIIEVRQPKNQLQYNFENWEDMEIIWAKEPQKELWSNGKTLEENHRLLWNWLADNSNWSKDDYFKEFDIEKPQGSCFACKFARKQWEKKKV